MRVSAVFNLGCSLLCLGFTVSSALPSLQSSRSSVAPAPVPQAAAPSVFPLPTSTDSCACVLDSYGYCELASYDYEAPALPLDPYDYEVMLNFRDESEALSELFGSISDPCSWQYAYIFNDTYYDDYSGSDYSSYNVLTCSQLPEYNYTKVTGFTWDGTVDTIDAVSHTVSGELPLQLLEKLDQLTSIEIFGTGPNGWTGHLPKSWAGNLPLVWILSLYNNSFTGEVPASWTHLNAFPSLFELSLSTNQLSGKLPEFDADSIGLVYELNLDSNFFTGTLPESYTSLANLSSLSLENNLLTGPLPDSWGSPFAFGLLDTLNVSSNKISGTLPESWGSATAFRRLSPLNDFVSDLTLSFIDLPSLTGSIPAAWSQSGVDTDAGYITVIVQPGTGICGDVPPYVLAFELQASSPNTQPINSTFARANLLPC